MLRLMGAIEMEGPLGLGQFIVGALLAALIIVLVYWGLAVIAWLIRNKSSRTPASDRGGRHSGGYFLPPTMDADQGGINKTGYTNLGLREGHDVIENWGCCPYCHAVINLASIRGVPTNMPGRYQP